MRKELYVPRVQAELLPRAEHVRIEFGHPQLDLDHLVCADAMQNGVVSRILGPQRINDFISNLKNFCLTRYRESDGLADCTDAVNDVDEALVNGAPRRDHNLERIASLRMKRLGTLIDWEELLLGTVDYRPHRMVPLLTDYGISGDAVIPVLLSWRALF